VVAESGEPAQTVARGGSRTEYGRRSLVTRGHTLPDSIGRQLPPVMNDKPGVARACWRLLNGSLRIGDSGPHSLDWATTGDSVTLTLWFSVDAGTSLRTRTDSTGVRGELITRGFGTDGTVTRTGMVLGRDPISGRRVGDPDPSRCVRRVSS
jgi:hypothetical protein